MFDHITMGLNKLKSDMAFFKVNLIVTKPHRGGSYFASCQTFTDKKFEDV